MDEQQRQRMVNIVHNLQLVLSLDERVRSEATTNLQKHEEQRGYMYDLLTLITSQEQMPIHVRLGAAVALKNQLKNDRNEGVDGSSCQFPDTADTWDLKKVVYDRMMERGCLREGLLKGVAKFAEGGAVGDTLTECLRLVVACDWPARWDKLGEKVVELILSNDVESVKAGMVCARLVTKCHEYKSRDPERRKKKDVNGVDGNAHQQHQQHQQQQQQQQQQVDTLGYFDEGPYPRWHFEKFCQAVFPPMLQVLEKVVERVGNNFVDVQSSDLLRNGCKAFWSGVQYAIPPFLADNNAHQAYRWLELLLKVLLMKVPPVQISEETDLDDVKAWKTKKWIGQTFQRFAQRYSDPGSAPKGEKHTAIVSELYSKQFAGRVTEAMIKVLALRVAGNQLSPRVANIAFSYLENAIELASCWKIMKQHIEDLLAKCVFPYLCFNDHDEEVWESNPLEFVRISEDIMQDFYSPRAAASNLLHALSKTRSKMTVIPFLEALVREILEPYPSTVEGSPERLEMAKKKWGVFMVLSSLKDKLIAKSNYSVQFLQILGKHVLPEVDPKTESDYPFLRAQGIWLLGMVAGEGWSQYSANLGQPALEAALNLLQDIDVGVRCTAATSLRSLMDAKEAVALVRPNVGKLLEVLLMLMDSLTDSMADSSSIIATIDTLFARYRDDVMPHAQETLKRLIQVFKKSLETMETMDDDEVAFSASQTLSLIQALFMELGEWKGFDDTTRRQTIAAVAIDLQPMMSIMFDRENTQLFLEELLSLYGAITYQYGKAFHEQLPYVRNLLPEMIKSYNGIGCDYIEDMVPPFDNFLCYDMPHLVGTQGALDAIAQVCAKTISSLRDDDESYHATKIAESLILNMKRFKVLNPSVSFGGDRIVAELLKLIKPRLHSAEEEKLYASLFCNVMQALYYDSTVVFSALDRNFMVNLTQGMLFDLTKMPRIHDKKSTIVGLSCLVRDGSLNMDEAYPDIVKGLVDLEKAVRQQRLDKAKGGAITLEDLQQTFAANGNGLHLRADPNGDSDLDDDEDLHRPTSLGPEASMSSDGGFNAATLALMQGDGEIAIDKLFSCPEEDEGDFESPLDSIDEVKFMMECLSKASHAGWWQDVGEEEQAALRQLLVKSQETRV